MHLIVLEWLMVLVVKVRYLPPGNQCCCRFAGRQSACDVADWATHCGHPEVQGSCAVQASLADNVHSTKSPSPPPAPRLLLPPHARFLEAYQLAPYARL